ncbi:MAG: hypothetical protein AUJ92_00865 [Armatimonadetes bacterium CG2_30_59_28]|nr:hypothetical protein [Armatimonadota bacterium]OIO98720.1 MAG: hypothetical protein AUJ92_00865 [Armatimonadetes bacterium CG2_30_59_28]PIU61825.1 MAG: hypothetical protein COS85_20190 [Armatimonadetes bacterium CG07_land_8_20_14_0_80_59_28]PIX41315.1 MAG: hypothetical protein COZ56_12400 [Armatimonadetes bacterium CG_4_8_14_3_um_filter_58_9]PIY43151.1 MAG: hypothetical protein COZ05_11920 [Armatimonadetes bacterium CG_4_10_14_3_um_filter_59_10]PJB76428.1 MAG: hypothetical protein CO095_025
MLTYAQDYDERLPGTYIDETLGDTTALLSFGALAYPYIKSARVFVCPSRSDNSASSWPATTALIPVNGYFAGSNSFSDMNNGPSPLADWASPADTILFLDTHLNCGGCELNLGGSATALSPTGTSGGCEACHPRCGSTQRISPRMLIVAARSRVRDALVSLDE